MTLTGAGSHASIDTFSSVTTVTIIDDESEWTSTTIAPKTNTLLVFRCGHNHTGLG